VAGVLVHGDVLVYFGLQLVKARRHRGAAAADPPLPIHVNSFWNVVDPDGSSRQQGLRSIGDRQTTARLVEWQVPRPRIDPRIASEESGPVFPPGWRALDAPPFPPGGLQRVADYGQDAQYEERCSKKPRPSSDHAMKASEESGPVFPPGWIPKALDTPPFPPGWTPEYGQDAQYEERCSKKPRPSSDPRIAFEASPRRTHEQEPVQLFIERASENLGDSKRARRAGFRKAAVEDLLTALELAVEAHGHHHSVPTRRPDMSLHVARRKAAKELAQLGAIPLEVEPSLQTLDRDRQRVRYAGEPSRISDATLTSLTELALQVIRGAQQLTYG